MATREQFTTRVPVSMRDHPSDLELIQSIALDRDRVAFDDLFLRHKDRAFGLAYHILQNSALAEEAVQEAMLAVWLAPKLDRADQNVPAWLLRIVAIKSMNVRRGRKRQSSREARISRNDVVPDSELTDNAERGETLEIVRRHFQELPELDSQLLACCFGANLTHQQISDLLGIPRRTITGRIQQALEQLRARLSNSGVALIMPLLSTELIHEALTTGHSCPPVQLVLPSKLPIRSRSIRHLSKATSKSGVVVVGGALAAVVIAAVAINSGITASSQKSPQPESPPAAAAAPVVAGSEQIKAVAGTAPPEPARIPTPAETGSQTSPAGPQSINRHWNFKEEPENLDIQIVDKNWVWGRRVGRGAMVSGNGDPVIAILPVTIHQQSCKLTFKITPSANSFSVEVGCLDGAVYQPNTFWQTITAIDKKEKLTTTLLITRGECVQLFNDHLNNHRKFDRDWPGDHLLIGFRNVAVEEITLQTISDEDAANEFKRLEPEIREIHKLKSERCPLQTLPQYAQHLQQ